MPYSFNSDFDIVRAIVAIGCVIFSHHIWEHFVQNLLLVCSALSVFVLMIAIVREFELASREARRQNIYHGRRYRACSGTRAAQDDDYKGESERLWREEQRRVLKDLLRPREPQYGRDKCTLGLSDEQRFTRWRNDCHTLLQTPELITKMPLPPGLPCPYEQCNPKPMYLDVCSHRMKKFYVTSRLEEKEVKEELRLWHPNGARVNQVSEGCKNEVLGMANEIVQVLLEILEDMEREKRNYW